LKKSPLFPLKWGEERSVKFKQRLAMAEDRPRQEKLGVDDAAG